MNRSIYLFVMVALLVSCNQITQNKSRVDNANANIEAVVSATIEELLAAPAAYKGKGIAISGMVTHVCKHGGQKCFLLAEDGETQMRINVGGGIDEFETDLEGSSVTFIGVFRVLNSLETESHIEDHNSKEHHREEMAHSQAEKASYFLEAVEYKEINP